MNAITAYIKRYYEDEESVGSYLQKKYELPTVTIEHQDPILMQILYGDATPDDTYTFRNACVNRLIEDYKKHNGIIIAYDYDDTVVPSTPMNNTKYVQTLLRFCSTCNFTMICFTARDKQEQIVEVRETLKKLHIRCDYINEDCDQSKEKMDISASSFHKIFYNIFLDDRAGLDDAIKTLIGFIHWYVNQPLKTTKNEQSNTSDINMFRR